MMKFDWVLRAVAGVALMLTTAPAAQAQKMAQAAPFTYSVLEVTPAFHSLPMLALKEFGGEFNLKLDYMQLQGGGGTGAVFAGGHGDVLMAGIDKAFGFRHAGLVDAGDHQVAIEIAGRTQGQDGRHFRAGLVLGHVGALGGAQGRP